MNCTVGSALKQADTTGQITTAPILQPLQMSIHVLVKKEDSLVLKLAFRSSTDVQPYASSNAFCVCMSKAEHVFTIQQHWDHLQVGCAR